MTRLTMIMKIQAVAFLAYAVGWFFIPDFINDTVLGWDTETVWARVLGGVFFGVAFGEWKVIEKLEERMDLVWMFAAIPIGILAALLWEQLADTYTGSDLFFWVSVAVTVVFGTAVTAARLSAGRDTVAV